ncbi:MAG: hypothetical protein C7B46_10225 [Sulfobacillus benefaciens]|uniref:Major facilitator superfamily (MFS) profile domain-containing protein n=1 Tax=Sulfobacillus benefaciens TaxID=453960 RepID=A0A2T2XFP7_9FIRM|nr:MAG: hypothetical protein C7B46_10225 [Sulfobacillus benefaciens]
MDRFSFIGDPFGVYALEAMAAATTGYLGGLVSDRVGRRQTIGIAWCGEAMANEPQRLMAATYSSESFWSSSRAQGPGLAATSAMVGDLVLKHRRESAYGTLHVVTNAGYLIGPPLSGLILKTNHWGMFFVFVAGLGLIAATFEFAFLPKESGVDGGSLSPSQHNQWAILQDKPFMLLLVSTFAGFVVYTAYEVILPIDYLWQPGDFSP